MNLDTFMIFPQIDDFEKELLSDEILKDCFLLEEEKKGNND